MLKKACAVGALALSFSLGAAPAFAGTVPGTNVIVVNHGGGWGTVLFHDAYNTVIKGGTDLGRGAGEVVAGVYTGIATTPQEVIGSLASLGR
jgi:hypothetical protein